ncbi:MAG: hypothetical protein KDN20_22285 [Verrucomicrobiae bacterium]|nr:hypothetical protein [Verrucomicrobiae bacterium]
MNRFLFSSLTPALGLFLFAITHQALAMISIGHFSPEQAKEAGITMHARKNGDAGVLVWLEFKKDGFLEKFTYAELQMDDAEGKPLLSAMLKPKPVVQGQSDDIVSVSFSAQPEQLKHCYFLVVNYGSPLGDVGHLLKVSDFIKDL